MKNNQTGNTYFYIFQSLKFSRIGFYLLTAAAFFLGSNLATAKSIYVQTQNSRWAGDGSYNNPYGSIEAAGHAAYPGDTIYLKAGTHYPTKDEAIYVRGGSAGSPIRIESEPGKWAILDYSNAGTKDGIIIAEDHFQIRWVEIRNGGGNGILISGNNCRVEGVTVHNCWKSGIEFSNNSNGAIVGNTVFKNAKNNQNRNLNGGWPGAVKCFRTNGTQVVNNNIFENWGEGIDINQSSGAWLYQNTTRDNYSINIYIDNSWGCTVENNTSTSYWNSNFLRFNYPAVGIGMANEANTTPRLENNVIRNNTIDTARFGIYYGRYGVPSLGMRSTEIYGNRVSKGVNALILIENGNHSGSVIRNNTLIRDWTATAIDIQGSTGISIYNNIYQ